MQTDRRTTFARPWAQGVPLALGIGLLAACQASVQADAKLATDSEGKVIQDFDRPLEAPPVQADPPPQDFSVEEYALLGARHDLNYAGPKSPTCQCLAVILDDNPNNPAFQWELSPPRLEPTTQWIIALSSNEVACNAAPQGTLGASYQGYAVDGNDVIVYVEALGEGRPMTSGALIPRPQGGGSVFVESAGAVYGKPLEGKGKRCKIPPPGGSAAKSSAPR